MTRAPQALHDACSDAAILIRPTISRARPNTGIRALHLSNHTLATLFKSKVREEETPHHASV
jgi:hypothetical protein